MSEQRPFKGRGIKEFWEGAPKQESLLEWLRPKPIHFTPSDLPDTPLEQL